MAVANEHKLKTVISAELDLKNASNAITQIEKINEISKKTAESLKQIEKAMQNIGKNKNNNSAKSASQSWLTQQQQMYKSGLQSYDQYAKQVQQKERQLHAELLNIRKTHGDNSKEFKQKLSEHQSYAKQVQQVEKQITSQMNAEAKARASYNQKELNSTISQYKKLNAEVQKMSTSSKGTFGGNIFNSMLSYGAITQITSAVQDLGRAMVDIQYNTVNNQRLMGDWSTELRDNLNATAVEMARTTGIQITDAQQIQGAWIRINDEYANNADLLGEISQLTAEFMNVGEIEDAESAVTLLNASLLQLKDSTQTTAQAAEEFLNKWAYMADKTAMGTADEYGTAIARYGASLRNLGGDMDDAIAQASVLADSLAMNGNEAGTALKTFNTYLTRDKTVSLMNDIAEATGDVSFKIADANGQLDDYRTLIGDVARAYQMYKDAGNDLMANKVLDAVGATRRRDVAQAMLNAVNSGSIDEYTAMSEGADPNYLESQNAALMDTLKNQWNALVVSMQEAAMQLGNAGLLDGITALANGAQVAFEAFSRLPEPMQQFASTLLMVGTASAGLKKLGEVTGLAEKISTAFNSGTQASREYATTVSEITQSFVDTSNKSLQSATSIDKTTQSFASAQSATDAYVSGLSNLNEAYANGHINAEQYSARTKELTESYQQQISSIATTAVKHEKVAQIQLVEAQSAMKLATNNQQAARSSLESATSSEQKAIASQKVEQADKEAAQAATKLKAAEKKLANAQKEVATATKLEANALNASSSAKDKYSAAEQKSSLKTKLSITSLKQKMAVLVGVKGAETMASASTQQFTWAQIASAAASKVAAGAMSLLTATLGMFLNPLTLITLGITALSAVFGNSKGKVEEYGETLSNLQSELDDTSSKIQELQELENQSGGLSDGQKAQLEALKTKQSMLETQIKLTEELKANEEFLNHQGGFLGFGGEDSGLEKAQDTLKAFQDAQKEVENTKSTYENWVKAVESGESNNQKMVEQTADEFTKASEKQLSAANDLITQYDELQRLTGQGAYKDDGAILSDEALSEAQNQLKLMEEDYKEASALVQQWATEHNVSFEQATQAISDYQTELEDTNSAISQLKSSTEALKGALDIQSQSGVLTLEQTYDLLSKMGDQAPLLTGALEEVNGGFKLNENAQTVLNELMGDNNEQMMQGIDLLLKGAEGAVAEANAIEENTSKVQENTEALDENAQKQKEQIENLTAAQQKIQEAMSNAGMEFDYNTDIEPLTFELEFEGENAEQEAQTTIDNIKAKIDEIKNNPVNPEVDAAKIEYLQTQLDTAIQKKIELSQPSFMSLDISQVDSSLQTALVKFQEYQTAVNELETLKLKGADTTEIDAAQQKVDTLAQELANLPDDTKIALGIDTSVDIPSQIEQIKTMVSNDEIKFKTSIDDGGAKEQAEEIKQTLEDIPDTKTVTVTTNAEGSDALSALKSNIESIKGKNVTVSSTVNGKVNVDALKSSINSVRGKTVNVKGNVSGKGDVDSLKASIDKVNSKTVNVTANVSGISSVNSLAASISSLKDKTVNVTANYKTKGGLGGLFGVNGTAHVNGTASGKAFVGGNWGAKQGGTALVGELGPEIRVNSKTGRWELLGAFGAQFAKINRSDIIFNHLQTEQLLKNGYATAAGGRGKQALVNGTVSGNAFAGGYNSSYKITEDKDVAATIAVKKAAEAAIKAAQAAEAAGENVSDALKEAAENAEKVAKSIEDITSKFINNVEDLQKRIADALKKQYQEEYDAREKLLKKEHEDKLDAIQKEIDAINGDRPEDKQAELEKLKADLAKWQGDNSTLGKAKQKEYMDKIAELEKEIKIDELEKQLEDENERYENSLDSESDGYDSVLAGLDDKMSEENLYTQANEMIKNQQKEQIEALLNKYDQHWDGWATLMGKTAGQIIAEEVGYALNNYKDVTGGTITDKGGHYSDGASLPSSGGGGSSTPPAPSRQIGVGTQVNMGNAPIYGQIGGAGYPQYFSSDPVYTVLQVNGDWLLTRWHGLGSGYTGWFKRSDVKSFDTGGYTGLDEGMAMLHAKERVLTAQQTAAFDKLVYNILPKLDKELMTTNLGESTVINNNGNTFNKELVSVNVDKIINNTPFDINNTEDNLDRMFRNSLKKSGINIKR